MWFTPPAWRPTPIGVGVATVAGTIHLGVRYLRATFDADAGGAFADLYLECLDEAASLEAATTRRRSRRFSTAMAE